MTARQVTLVVVALAFAGALAALWLHLAGGIYLYSLPGGGLMYALDHADLWLWWRQWRAGDPADRQALAVAGVSAAWPVAILAAMALLMGARSAVPMFRRSVHGDARWATRREIKRAGLLDGQGVVAGRLGRFGPIVTTPENTALRARSRDGKGVSVVIPTLLSYPHSVIVLDVKGENRLLTAGYRAAHGQRVFTWNPFAADGRSHGFNAFDAMPADRSRRVGEIMAEAERLYPADGDRVWAPSARNLFVACALLLDETPGEVLSHAAILREGTGRGHTPRDHLLGRLRARNYVAHETGKMDRDGNPVIEWEPVVDWDGEGLPPLSDACADALLSFTAAEGRMSQSIVGTFVAALTLWQSPMVAAATAKSDFDPAEFRRVPSTLYVTIPANKIATAAPLLGPFFSTMLSTLTDELGSGTVPVLLLMDELARLRYQPIIEAAPSYIGGYGVWMLSVLQSDGQIMAAPPAGYGVHGAKAFIDSHSSRIGFAPANVEDAKALSEFLGDETVAVQNRSAALFGSAGTEHDVRRPLMLPQELMRLGKRRAIVVARDVRPFLVRRVVFYRDREMLARLASVAPSLRAVPWWRRPNRDEIERARDSGELAVTVPLATLPPERRIVIGSTITRPMRAADAPPDGPLVDLARVDVLGIDDLPTLAAEPPIDDAAVAAIVDGLWSALDAADPEPGSAPGISLNRPAPSENVTNAVE